MVNFLKLDPSTEYVISTTLPPILVQFFVVSDEQLAAMQEGVSKSYTNYDIVADSFDLTPDNPTHKFLTGDSPINIAWFDSQAGAEYVRCNPTKNDSKPG